MLSQESKNGAQESVPAGEPVVISGMSGLYPGAHHVKELADILYNKVNPVTSENCRWSFNHPEMTGYTGKVPDLNYFDAQFFKVHYMLANNMDVMSRKILEQAYMAIYDAGINPDHLNGKSVGVFIGIGSSETEMICIRAWRQTKKAGFSVMGCSKTMYANRISYWLNTKGPSVCVNQACCSSTVALELAYRAILRGDCESAIVGGASLCLHPHTIIHYGRLIKLSKDGKTKSFAENADGTAKSEGINILFLQKAKDALRVYAEIVNVKSEFLLPVEKELGLQYDFYRNSTNAIKFLKQFYEESNVSPQTVEYIEGCGSAIPEVDKEELELYEKVFCDKRNNPLLVGSVMSNIGNVEAASGIAAITKILLGYNTGVLAGNLHCETPRRDVMALRNGRMAIVRDHTPIGQGYTALSGFSTHGVMAHVLLKGHNKIKDPSRYKSAIPHLVLVSGRQDTAVVKILNDLKSRPVDPEEIALLNHAHGAIINGHLGRGFTILGKNEVHKTVCLSEKADYFDYIKRPVWFVYSGMGSQYNGMGVDLMRIPVFATAIERCDRALRPKGIDIVHIITSSDKTIFNNILHSFVGIAAIQIGLTDVLRELGIEPDKIMGHSVGELGCAYADGCFTAEEMILSAYNRGLVSVQTPFIHGSMAAVGMGYRQILTMCPPEIEVACHNSPESCTISGPSDIMGIFVASLVEKGIFAKEVPCSNIAYHSSYIANAGPPLLKNLKEVIKSPKARSERWVSTSVPKEKWDEPSAKYASAEYYTNNLLNSVLFEEASKLIPPNAILVEIAPHGLLQSILKRSLPESCTNISLALRGTPDNTVFLLKAIGKLYMEGLIPNIQSLYPKVEFPVSAGTPMLSHLVEWAHNEKWSMPLHLTVAKKNAAVTKNIISLHEEEHSYLHGHVIGGKILYPFAAVLVAVWDTLAITLNVPKRTLPVQFYDVMLYVQPIIHNRRKLGVDVTLQRGSGRFEVTDDIGSIIASGFIKNETNCNEILPETIDDQPPNITSTEIYDHFLLRGFSYKGSFRSIDSTNLSFTEARIQWCDNWVTFIDGILQLNNLRHSHEAFSHPNFIGKLIINPDGQDKCKDKLKTATVLETYNLIKCGGVLMTNVKFNDLPIPTENITTLRRLKFIPHFSKNEFNFETILNVYLQMVAENVGKQTINVLGIYDNQNTFSKFNKIKSIMEDVPEVTTIYTWLNKENIVKEEKVIFSEVNLVLINNLATANSICQILHGIIENNTFVLNIRDSVNEQTHISSPCAHYQVVCDHSIQSSQALELVRWRPTNTSSLTSVISVHSSSDFALLINEGNSILPQQNLLVMTTYPAVPGLKNIFVDIKKKFGNSIRLVMNDNCGEEFDDDLLVNVDLAVKVIKNGVLGGEYYVPLDNTCTVEDNIMLQRSQNGQIASLKWVQIPPQQNRPRIKVKIHYASLNDLDAKRFTGIVPFNAAGRGFGMDFSGTTESGAHVMGLVDCGAVSTVVHAHPDLLWPVPEHWSLEDAATVPFAYCLAYYCLSINCKLFPGIRVLIHGGAGSLGQAIISLALAHRCEVFVTVGDVRKKQFLLKMFPTLKAENIGNSRDLTFSDLVRNATNGEGVIISISNLNGEPKTVSFECVGASGATIDLNLIPGRENFKIEMSHLDYSRSYNSMDFFSIFNESGNTMKNLQRMVSDGIVKGWVRPLSRVTYIPEDAYRAFHLLAASNHRGRVLLHLQKANINVLHAQPRLECSSEKCHIIISDHEGFGQNMADMLISRGVRNIRINLSVPHEDFKLQIRQWQYLGVHVCFNTTDTLDVPGLFADLTPASVEGIYIIITNKLKSVLKTATSLEAIDAVTRKIYPDLKYFTVINTANSVGEETCVSRNKHQFSATMLLLSRPTHMSLNDNLDHVWIREALDVVERAITSEESVLSAHIVSTPHLSLLHQIAAVAGITITQNKKGNITLSDLGLDLPKANIVSAYLRDAHNVLLTVDDIKNLTLERIKYIDETLTRTDFEYDKGLNRLFTRIESDEVVATTEMIFMPIANSETEVTDNEFDVNSPYLCIIPGIEGHYGRFIALCERIKLPVLVLQPDLASPHETISNKARRYAEMLSQTGRPTKKFYLLGYESGVFVVLEMAAILEEKGFTTLVFCVGNPEEIHTEIKEHLKGLETNEALQDAIVRHMYTKITNSDINELETALAQVSSWQQKLDVTVNMLKGKVSHSKQYARQFIVAAYGRIVSLLQYKMKVRALRSQMIFLQPMSTTAVQHKSLQQFSQHPVICHQLEAPLWQAPEDLRCAAYINAHIDTSVMEELNKKNLCETYVLSPSLDMTWSFV